MSFDNGAAKTILTTTLLAMALMVVDTDKVNWLVALSEPLALVGLLLVHGFACLLIWSQKGALMNWRALRQAKQQSIKWQQGKKPLSARVDVYLNTIGIGVIAWFGLLLILGNLLVHGVCWVKS